MMFVIKIYGRVIFEFFESFLYLVIYYNAYVKVSSLIISKKYASFA